MVQKSGGRWAWLWLVSLVACAGGGTAVKKPAPEPEVRGGEGIKIQIGGAEEDTTPSAGETPVVAGQGGEESAAAGGETGAGESPAPAEESDPGVRLVDAGRGPRRALRYHPASGSMQSRSADVEIDFTIDMGGSPQTVPTTKVQIKGESRIDAIGGTGDIEFTSEIIDMQTLGGPPNTATYAQQLKGSSTTQTISNRGVILKTDGTASQFGGPDVWRLMDHLTGVSGAPPALPAESIGVGARWEEQGRVDIQGVIVEIATTSELTALQGERATIRFTSSVTVDTRSLNQGGVAWKDIVISETGAYEVNLSKLVPETMTRELHVEASMDTGGAGDAGMKLVMRMDARAN